MTTRRPQPPNDDFEVLREVLEELFHPEDARRDEAWRVIQALDEPHHTVAKGLFCSSKYSVADVGNDLHLAPEKMEKLIAETAVRIWYRLHETPPDDANEGLRELYRRLL